MGCVDPEEFQGTYEELLPIDDDRDYALKLTLFRFGDEIGGVVRFHEMNPVFSRFCDNPYLCDQVYCSYFGETRVVNNVFRFSISDGPGGRDYTFRFEDVDSEQLTGTYSTGDGDDAVEVDVEMVRTTSSTDNSCAAVGEVALTVRFDSYDVDEYPEISLAVLFAGYHLSGEDSRRVVLRSNNVEATTVRRGQTPGEWATEQEVVFPEVPPEEVRSAAEDPDGEVRAQYAVGYVVLFNDGNRDGAFHHQILGDEVLAISLEQVMIYVAGDPSDLHPDVQTILYDLDEVPRDAYDFYSVDFEVVGQDAVITSASTSGSNRMNLTAVPEGGFPVFPVLLPREDSE
jgi:hypothetical protein